MSENYISMSEFLDYYKNNKNNISYWYPKVKDCGIPTPKTIIIPTPEEVGKAYFLDNGKDYDTVYEFVRNTIIPQLPQDMFFLFMKNGTFSNKFDFSNCKIRKSPFEIANSLIEQNYHAELYGAGGLSEICIRDFIGSYRYIEKNMYCIYNGMPLRPEFRVFYDFDNRKVLYTANYWDYDYCYEAISRNKTDACVYKEAYANVIYPFYIEHKEEVEQKVSECMKNVDLSGKWSVDILWDEESKTYYLIDMALANQSAYWREDYE